MSKKYGSFDVEIEYYNENKKQKKTHTVSPLSQQDLANGWRLALPKIKMINTTIKKDNGDEINVRKTNESFFKINLAQLPPHLFSKLKNVYRRGQFTHNHTRDNCYVYIVHSTPADTEIRKLARYCELYDTGFRDFSNKDILDIRKCLAAVNDNEINGWVVMKSNKLFNNI
jgi:hypothetical protein